MSKKDQSSEPDQDVTQYDVDVLGDTLGERFVNASHLHRSFAYSTFRYFFGRDSGGTSPATR
jgi:hypothetical protein